MKIEILSLATKEYKEKKEEGGRTEGKKEMRKK